MSARFSYHRQRRRNWFIHAKVRSTTQRHRPSPLPCLVFRLASQGKMWQARRARRIFPRRRPCPPVCNRGDDAADHAVLGAAEWHRAVVRSGLSRDSWLRSVRLPTECRARHRSNGACCHVWLDRSDSALFAAPKNRSHRTTVNNRTRPVDPAITRKPIQQPEVNQVPNSGLLPIA
jgi:hypothetical protein